MGKYDLFSIKIKNVVLSYIIIKHYYKKNTTTEE